MRPLWLVIGLTAALGTLGTRARTATEVEPSRERPQARRWTPATGPVLRVPRRPIPVIDGRIDSAEWAGATIERLSNDFDVRLQHDGRYLFLAVSNRTGQGFPSVCAVQGDTVRVLHASAALGSVGYWRSADGWSTRDSAFVFGMRNRDTTAQARAERRDYLVRHQWLASTFHMGHGQAHEIQVSLDIFDASPGPRVAIGYFRTEGPPATWPESLAAAGEGCANEPLLRGSVPPHPQFQPAMYPDLELLP